MSDAELLAAAVSAAKRALPSVSGFAVGAALRADDGRVFEGCNIESPSLLQVFCAERVALLGALAAGARRFDAIAVYSPERDEISPCGLCRQMFFEWAPDLRVFLVRRDGGARQVSLRDLLPEAFVLK